MLETWYRFLEQQGGKIEDNNTIKFISTDRESEKLINEPLACPLSDFAILEVSGGDAQTFLHGQFINDLDTLDIHATQFSAWCNPKGQVISNFLIIKHETGYLLIFKSSLKDFVLKRLTMFVLRSDVSIVDQSEKLALLGIANTTLNIEKLINIDDLTVATIPDDSGRFLMIGNTEAIETGLNTLPGKPNFVSSSTWQQLDIQAGIPWITSETQEQFLPQMLNLDALRGLNYQKGCYPGQEVIARLHYRGEVKKRLSLLKAETSLSAGDKIYQKDSDNAVGHIINTSELGDATYVLAVVELNKMKGQLFSDPSSKDALTLFDLPYAIEP